MAYSLKEAADAVGRSKPTILRAIQSGMISAAKNDDGEWAIQPAELHRVYAATSADDDDAADDETPGATSGLRRAIALLERERAAMADQIYDLRRRLDTAEEERRAVEAERRDTERRLTLLLTGPEPMAPKQRKPRPEGYWKRVWARQKARRAEAKAEADAEAVTES